MEIVLKKFLIAPKKESSRYQYPGIVYNLIEYVQ